MKIHVSDLEGVALDYAVAKSCDEWNHLSWEKHSGIVKGYSYAACFKSPVLYLKKNVSAKDRVRMRKEGVRLFSPSSDWAQCGPLVDEFNIWLRGPVFDGDGCAADFGGDRTKRGFGPTPLIAVCRSIVSAKLGDEIEIPDELMTK